MAIEFSPGGRGIMILAAAALVLLVWFQTSGALLTLAVLTLGIGVATVLLWGFGTRLFRRVGGMR